jgi:uncharacterized membrane protein
MIEIAIWAMAIMLVVKGLDVLHQQRIAEVAGNPGSHYLALATFGVAVIGAVVIVKLAHSQATHIQNPAELGRP